MELVKAVDGNRSPSVLNPFKIVQRVIIGKLCGSKRSLSNFRQSPVFL
jgi:hypothetical protein